MWLHIILVVIMIFGLSVFLNGLKKKSQMQLYIGGLALISPIFIWINIPLLLLLAPVIAILLAQFTFKKISPK